jgi:hypothetical protein
MTETSTLRERIDTRPDLSTDEIFQKLVKEFRRIGFCIRRLLGIWREINQLRAEARGSIGQEQHVLPIIGPSQSGKSIALEHYCETVIEKEGHPTGKLPLLYVRISNGSSLKQLQADILGPLVVDDNGEMVEDELDAKTQVQFRNRVRKYAKKRSCEVIALDEAQHLITRNAGKTATAVAESIKLMAIEGAASFIVLGVPETWAIFQANNKQLPLRSRPPIFLNPLDFERPHEAELFAGYVVMLDAKLVEHGITSELSGFVDEDMIASFWEISGGVVGIVSRLVRVAWEYAYALGLSVIPKEFLEFATDDWALALGIARSNPFRNGPRSVRIVKDEIGFKDKPGGTK